MQFPDNIIPKTPDLFPAGIIAHCLSLTPQAIRKRLRDIPASDVRCIAGNHETAVWTFKALPEKLKADLEIVARRRGYRGAEDMLRNPPAPVRRDFNLSEIHHEDISYATKLRAALSGALAQQTNLDVSSSEIEAGAVFQFQKQFGHIVTPRHLRALLKRTIERDGGLENWDRMELYLPDNPRRKVTAQPARAVRADLALEFEEITQHIQACADPANPNQRERNGIWTLAFARHAQLIGQGLSKKAASRRLRDFLFSHAPFLAASRGALLKSFERKLSAWIESGRDAQSLRDKRENNSGNHDSYEFPQQDRQLLIHRAVWKFGGRVAQAWRDILTHNEFSAVTQQRYAGKSKSKSHVPHLIMEDVGPDVEHMTILHQGQRAWDSAKGYVERDYNGTPSLAVMQGDDVTLPVYFYVPSGDGYKLTRGQCLIFICARSLRVLGYSLQQESNYNSMVIRSLCTRTFAEFGPPKLLYFERGLWQKSKLVTGTKSTSFGEVSQGLREFGIEFKHAIRPRSKVVERVIGMLQNLMEGEPGYCGRNERKDAPEILRKRMLDVSSGRAQPQEYFRSFAGWDERLGEIIAQYNNEPQQGKMLAGLSPEEALEKFQDLDDPRIDFSPQIQHLLSYHKSETDCTLKRSVTIKLRNETLNYRGAELEPLTGRRVLVWLDPENTETAIVTDMDRTPESFVRVYRSRSVNPFADDEQSRMVLKNEFERINAQVAPIETRYNILKTKFAIAKRTTLVDGQTRELGERFKEARKRDEENNRLAKKSANRAARATERYGVPISPNLSEQDLRDLEEISKS